MRIDIASHPPAVGTVAPPFALPATNGRVIALSDFRDRQGVLVAFFPLAWSPVCTAELCAFSEDWDRFADAGIAVLPISVDALPTLREYRSNLDLRVELLSDFRREACARYGTLRDDFHSERAYFLIDRAGVVQWAHVEASTGHRRETAELLSVIATLPLG